MDFKFKANIITSDDFKRIITRLAHEVLEKNHGTDDLVIIGLRTRGAFIADRLSQKINEIEGKEIPKGYPFYKL